MAALSIAVTGGSGRIGSAVIQELLSRGHRVINLDRRPPEKPLCPFVEIDLCDRDAVRQALQRRPRWITHWANRLRDRASVRQALQPVDAVCHLGEIPSLNRNNTPADVLVHNVTVGSNILHVAAELKLQRVIYTSSCQAYGIWGPGAIAPKYLPIDEDHPLLPQNAYGLSKATNEKFAEQISATTSLPVSIFRFPMIVWATERYWAMPAAYQQKAPNDGMGTYLYVGDAARAYSLALEADRPGCQAYLFVAPDSLYPPSTDESLNPPLPGYPPLPPGWPKDRVPVLTDKALSHLNWAATWHFRSEYAKYLGNNRP